MDVMQDTWRTPWRGREPLERSSAPCALSSGDPPPYGDSHCGPAYWDARHAQAGDEPFDWYADYSGLRSLFGEVLPSREEAPEILDIGSGTSEVPVQLYEDGWRNVIGIDTSVVAAARAQGARRHAGKPELQFLQMDACSLDFPDECFHAVFDKALLDTLTTGGHAFLRVKAMLSEVRRVLKPGGVYILVSHAGVGARLPYLTLDPGWDWRIEVAKLPKPPPGPLVAKGADLGEEGAEEGSTEIYASSGFFHVYVCTMPFEEEEAREEEESAVVEGAGEGLER